MEVNQTPLNEIPELVREDELEALCSLSAQHCEAIFPQEVISGNVSKQLKISDSESIYIEGKSKKAYLDLTGKFIGIDHHVLEILRRLDIVNDDARLVKQYSEDIRAVQICGMAGAGKTTLAKIVYNKIRPLYPYSTFLEDISENAKRKGIMSLQRQLLTDLQMQECPDLKSSSEATFIIKHTFRNQRVLIVLDDVDSPKQIHPLVQKLSWFGPGSKIIITTRHRRCFLKDDRSGVIANYEIGQMSDDEALRLFNKHAFRGCPWKDYHNYLSKKIIPVIGRLPLTIEVVASHLYLKRQELFAWTMTLSELETMVSPSKYQKAFMVSFNSLSAATKRIFLDIACFLIGKNKRFAKYVYMALGSSPIEIDTLCDMSLLEIGENNDLQMHGKLRNFGREVASEESSWGSARLWNHKHALSTLRRRKGGEEIVALALEADKSSTGSDRPAKPFTCEDFCGLKNLWFLKLGNANIYGDFKDILSNLKWLDWEGCPETLEVTSLHLSSLIILELSWSNVTRDWNGWSQLEMINLKVLNLTGCTNLLGTPNLSHCQCLEMLILEDCIRLVELHPSIGDLKSLVSLNLKSCSTLNTLPEKLDELAALKELLIDATSICEIPCSIGDMKQLKTFSASGCTWLSELPSSIGKLGKLQKLSLRDCHGLTELPNSIGELGRSLRELDVSGTSISRLPISITKLRRLRVLRMDSCFIKEFPPSIRYLSRLKEIHATRCISMEGPIPSDIGKLKCLRILKLQHSKISSLPSEIVQLSNLQTLDLLHCDMLQNIPRLPSSLTDLHVNPRLWKVIRCSETTESCGKEITALTKQIKDTCTGFPMYRKGERPFQDFDTFSEVVPYPFGGGRSSSPTPAWDFTGPGRHETSRMDSRSTMSFGGDRTPGGVSISPQSCDIVSGEAEEHKESVVQDEPGVYITLETLPSGGNCLKRVRFSRKMFDERQAERWWTMNRDRIKECYNTLQINPQTLDTPGRSEDEFQRDLSNSRMGSARESPMVPSTTGKWGPRNYTKPTGSKGHFPPHKPSDHGGRHCNPVSSAHGLAGVKDESASMDASCPITSSPDEASISYCSASEVETEHIELDEPGVYITIRQLVDGTREIQRVRFSRKRFGEVQANEWWKENRERIEAKYLRKI